MPNTSQKGIGNKKRLGRGLGSLLTTDVGDFEDSPKVKEEPKAVAKPQKQEPVTKPQASNVPKTAAPVPSKPEPVQEKPKEKDPLKDLSRIWSLSIEKVIPNQTQPRKDFLKEPLEELASSIKEQGLLQPVTVRKKGENFEIIAGERRWRASQLAGLKEIPAIIKEVDDQKSMELALIENLQREDLNPIEEAMGYQLLIDDYDLSQQELAVKVGKSRSAVTNALRVLTLPRDVRQMVRQGLLSVGHAKVLLGVEDIKSQVKLARKAIQKKLSVRALEKEVSKAKKPTSETLDDMDVSDRLVQGLAEDLQKRLGTKVKINYKSGKGRVEIAFYSDAELNRICETIKN